MDAFSKRFIENKYESDGAMTATINEYLIRMLEVDEIYSELEMKTTVD